MKKLYKDQVLGLILVAIAAFFAWQTSLMPKSTLQGDPGPAIFPYAACFIMGVCGIVLFALPNKKQGRKFLTTEEWKRLGVLYAHYVLYFALLWLVGYRIAIPVMLLLISYLFSRSVRTPVWKVVVYTVGVSVGLYILYIVIMGSRLPAGLLFGGR